jgi:tryptophan-rich sensory protein
MSKKIPGVQAQTPSVRVALNYALPSASFTWLITAAAGLAANLFALRMGETFAQLKLPLFFPPVWLLPLGWAAALICLANAVNAFSKDESPKAATAFYVALGLVICWAVLFFRLEAPRASAASGIMLTGVLLHLRRLAEPAGFGRRFIPCCMWAGYQAYLNLGICLMN